MRDAGRREQVGGEERQLYVVGQRARRRQLVGAAPCGRRDEDDEDSGDEDAAGARTVFARRGFGGGFRLVRSRVPSVKPRSIPRWVWWLTVVRRASPVSASTPKQTPTAARGATLSSVVSAGRSSVARVVSEIAPVISTKKERAVEFSRYSVAYL